MIKLGFLDDDYSDIQKNMHRSFKKNNIELITLEDINNITNIEIVINFILSKQLLCLLVDYDLMNFPSKNLGTKIIKELNEILPSFPCILFTNYVENGISEKLVPSIYIRDKNIILKESDSQEFIEFVKFIENGAECFIKRLTLSLEEYNILYSKYSKNEITADEEFRFYSLYRVLRAYNYVDDIPDILLYKDTKRNIQDMLSILDKIEKNLIKK